MPDRVELGIPPQVLAAMLRATEGEAEAPDDRPPLRPVAGADASAAEESELREAVGEFQSVHGLAVTGRLDATTLRHALLPPRAAVELNDAILEPLGRQPLHPDSLELPPSLSDPTNPVLPVQRALRAAGYFSGPLSGQYDAATVEAVKRFEAASLLPVDGVFSEDDWLVLLGQVPSGAVPIEELFPVRTASHALNMATVPPTVHSSSPRGVVGLCQRLLRKNGQRCPVDGYFRERTEAAVRALQAEAGVTVDGVVGPQTWGLLLDGLEPLALPPRAKVNRRVLKWLLSAVPGEAGELAREGRIRVALRRAQETLELELSGEADRPTLVALCRKEGIAWERATLLELVRAQVVESEDPTLAAKRASVVEHALAGLGASEWDEVTRGIVDGYFPDGTPWNERHWCALAVSQWLRDGLGVAHFGDIPLGRRVAAVHQIALWATQEGRLDRQLDGPVPMGALVLMPRNGNTHDELVSGRGSGHVGLVISEGHDTDLVTIEGNVSDAIAVRHRPKSSLTGIVRWW